jgi:hypothetical protein
MVKCYYTGVMIRLEESFLLDFARALNVLKGLRQRAATIQRIIDQLGPYDDVEVFSVKKNQIEPKRNRRLVSKATADTLAAAYPEGRLFISWPEWRARYKPEHILVNNETETDDPGLQSTMQIRTSYDQE